MHQCHSGQQWPKSLIIAFRVPLSVKVDFLLGTDLIPQVAAKRVKTIDHKNAQAGDCNPIKQLRLLYTGKCKHIFIHATDCQAIENICRIRA